MWQLGTINVQIKKILSLKSENGPFFTEDILAWNIKNWCERNKKVMTDLSCSASVRTFTLRTGISLNRVILGKSIIHLDIDLALFKMQHWHSTWVEPLLSLFIKPLLFRKCHNCLQENKPRAWVPDALFPITNGGSRTGFNESDSPRFCLWLELHLISEDTMRASPTFSEFSQPTNPRCHTGAGKSPDTSVRVCTHTHTGMWEDIWRAGRVTTRLVGDKGSRCFWLK